MTEFVPESTNSPANQSTPEVTTDIRRNPEAIWLSPICQDSAHYGEGRTWAAPAPDDVCDEPECGEPWVRYVREDLATPARGGDELREALEQIAGLPHGLDIGYAGDIARAALASTDMAGAGEGLDRATLKHCAQTIRDRAVTISATSLGGGNVSEASKIAARHLISAAEAIEKDMAAAPPVEGLTSGEALLREALQRIQDEPDHTLPIVTAQRLRNIASFALLGERLP